MTGEAPDRTFEDRLAAVLAREVPGFRALQSAERLSAGASQETYRVTVVTDDGERRLALRRAAGGVEQAESALESGAPGLRVEADLIRVARAAGVPEPEVLAVLGRDDGLGAGFLMEWLDGETLGARIVRSERFEQVRPGLARQCGQILARIHALDVDASGLRGLLQEVTPESYLQQTWERYLALDHPQPMIDFTGVWLREHRPRHHRTTLVHNDFRNGNLMVDEDGVIAVLDWEIAHLGDPMRDLGWICTNSWRFGGDGPVGGFGERDDLYGAYEEASGYAVDAGHVRWWEVFGSFWWAIGCLGMAEHYRTGPDQTVERPAIGRRSSECQVDCVNLLIPGPVELLRPAPMPGDPEMPTLSELVGSVRDFLREDVSAETRGRSRFLARVAANSLDVVARDLEVGSRHRQRERRRLAELVGHDGTLSDLRRELGNRLRSGALPLEHPGLREHLRTTVVNQVAIDQPSYSGLRRALTAKPSAAP